MRFYRSSLVFLLLLGCDDGLDLPKAPARAKIIESEAELIGGPIAQGQIGDILLENSEIRVILQRPGRAISLLPYGGTIIDADLQREEGEAGQDVFREVGLFLNIAHTFNPDRVEIIDDGSSGNDAVVRFTGKASLLDYVNLKVMVEGVIDLWEIPEGYDDPIDVSITQDYILSPGANRVKMITTLKNDGVEALPLLFAWFFDPGGDLKAYTPGSEAFDQEQAVTLRFLGLVGEGSVSYGFLPVEDRNLMINTVGILGVAPDVAVTDLINFPTNASRFLAPGEEAVFESFFIVGKGDMADIIEAVAEQDGRPTGTLRGRVTIDGKEPAARARLSLTNLVGTPLAFLRADENGEFSANIQEGEFRLRALLEGHPADPRDQAEFIITAGKTTEVELAIGRGAAVHFRLTDANGQLAPGKITVVGLDPNPAISLFKENDNDPLPFGITSVTFSATGEGTISLSPGRYQLVATRGLEFERVVQEVNLAVGDEILFEATLPRVVDTTGYISSDFHVHTAFSSDARVFFDDRLVSMIAEGMEFFAATEHEFVLDPKPHITRLGLEDRIAAMSGEEITTVGYGHFGAFPMPVDPTSSNGGAIDWSNEGLGLDPVEIFSAVNSIPGGDRVVQINHPRRSPAGVVWNELFDMIDLTFDQDGPRTGPLARDPVSFRLSPDAQMIGPGFHAIEIYNFLNIGGLGDWFNFLNAGFLVAGTGNSDTHTIILELSGFPRNFLRVGEGRDDPRVITDAEVVEAVRNLRVTVAGGPFVTIRARNSGGEAAEGDLLAAAGGALEVEVRIQAPLWIPFNSVELYENGVLIATDDTFTPQIVPGAEGGNRQEAILTFQVAPTEDAYYVAVVRGLGGNLYPWVPYNLGSSPNLDDLFAGNVNGAPPPQSFTNPVFVDEDGDGVFTPSRQVVQVQELDDNFTRLDAINPIP